MNNFQEKLQEARQQEAAQNKPCYVVWSALDRCYSTQDTMPMMGEWYTSDGIQHGGRIFV